MPSSRPIDPQKMIRRLEKKHAHLEAKVAELAGRPYLTPLEQMKVQQLKKKKLATKDELVSLRRQLAAS